MRKLHEKAYSVRIAHGMQVYVRSRSEAEREAMRIQGAHPMLSVWVAKAGKTEVENNKLYA